jgi:hypothetical protein
VGLIVDDEANGQYNNGSYKKYKKAGMFKKLILVLF